MRLESLRLRNFRNLVSAELSELGDTIVLQGANGQGKTNILEAAYLCATGRSFRQARPEEMLTYNSPEARVSGVFLRNDTRHQIDIQITPKHRQVRLDDRLVRQASRLLQLINVVAFFPDDLKIAKGSPEERRRFLDRLVAAHFPEFIDSSLAYAHALRSRNALLKKTPAPQRSLVNVFDEQLIHHGTHVQERRKQALEIVLPAAKFFFENIMQGTLQLGLELVSGVKESADSFADSFRKSLDSRFPRDCLLHQTTVGPHRADLLLSISGHDARTYASQGQQRAIVLALKLAEMSSVKERIKTPPILLLDDVSSELDAERNRLLFNTIAQLQGQLWVSTTGIAPLAFESRPQNFFVSDGKLTKQPN